MVLTKLFAGQQWRHSDREQTYGQGERQKEEKSGMYEESNIAIYIIICKIDSQREFAV